MMKQLSHDEFDGMCIKLLSKWKKSKRRTVTLDAKIYKEYFSFIQPRNMVIDSKNTDRIIFVQFDRLAAIKAIEETKELHYGPQICRSGI